MSLKPIYATESTLQSTSLNSLTNGGTVTASSDNDNSTNRYLDGSFSIELAGAAASTGIVSLFILEGDATGKVATTEAVNRRHIMDVQLNGTTTARKTKKIEGMPKYWREHLVNNSGVALAASGNTIKFTGLNYEDA